MQTNIEDAFAFLLNVAQDCRDKQKAYRRRRSKANRQAAEQAETVLDALLLKYQTIPQSFDIDRED